MRLTKKELRALFEFIKECYPIELSWARGPTKLWSLNISSLFRPHALVTEQVLDVADVDAGSIHIRRTLRAKIAQTEVFYARGFDVAPKHRADAVNCVPFASSSQQAGRPLIHRLALA